MPPSFASRKCRITFRRCSRCAGDRVLFPTATSDASIPPGPARICPCDISDISGMDDTPSSSTARWFGLKRELLRAGMALAREGARLAVLKGGRRRARRAPPRATARPKANTDIELIGSRYPPIGSDGFLSTDTPIQ